MQTKIVGHRHVPNIVRGVFGGRGMAVGPENRGGRGAIRSSASNAYRAEGGMLGKKDGGKGVRKRECRKEVAGFESGQSRGFAGASFDISALRIKKKKKKKKKKNKTQRRDLARGSTVAKKVRGPENSGEGG